MSTQASSRGSRRSNRVLGTLFLGMFVMGGSELLVVGVLDVMAGDLDVSASTAGALVTVYALGLAFGRPLLTALTMRGWTSATSSSPRSSCSSWATWSR
ncbi:hypothetical protein GCM10010252_27100 [Streptomyces aureoverticillatus]|nr:hypothetical protein GCM10010252_27100 [Streptomyces aureoverticillatus]